MSPRLLLALAAFAGLESALSGAEPPNEEKLVSVATAVIGHEGGVIATPDGTLAVDFAPNPLREPTRTQVWSIAAPGGAGFAVNGASGPAKLTCWPPDSPWSPGTAGARESGNADPAAGPPAAADGGVEVLGPDQAWTTVKSELRPDGSRVIEFTDDRKKLRERGLVKGTTGPYVLYPQKATVLRRQSVRFKAVELKAQQEEWKRKIEETEDLAPIPPPKPAPTPPAAADEDDLAPIVPVRDELAPIVPVRDELAPIVPVRKAAPPRGKQK